MLAAMVAVLMVPATAGAQGAFGPLNDLFALGQGEGQTPNTVPTMTRAEPPLVATPRAKCGPGADPEPGIQGRVPAGTANGDGFRCNVTLLAHQGNSGGFKTLRYVDTTGRECAYYDTALLFPLNAIKLSPQDSTGITVLDMSDPAKPVQTDQLTELPMLSPHESLVLNAKRGLIAAVLGNPSTYPGLVAIYDASQDCRHPVLQSDLPLARLGHESGFSPDGKTFYAAGTAYSSVTAIDVTDPKAPHVVSQINETSHGLSISDDGNRAYIADPGGEMLTLDVSQIQARKPDPQAREISRLTWKAASIPQNAIPFTEDGHPYVLEFDEYTAGTTSSGDANDVGAGRIIDMADETQPKVIADLRLQVNQHDDHAAAAQDPGAFSPVQGYAAHYCGIPSRVDPKVVACSFIASGLRVFDISKLTEPKEMAYFVAPTVPRAENGTMASDYAMSQPVVVARRKEIWYTDGTSGFYVLRVADDAWPSAQSDGSSTTPAPASGPKTRRCASRRAFRVKVRLPRGAKATRIRARLGGKKVRARQRGRYVRLTVNLRGTARKTVRLKVRVTLSSGKTVKDARSYHPCRKRA